MDCVIAGGSVAPTSVPAWTEGAAESAPSVTQLFADTLEKLTGDLGVRAAGSPERGHTADAAKDSEESTDGSVTEDSAGDDKPAGYTEVCQVSWQPICVVPELVPSAVEAPATPSAVVEEFALSMAEGRMREDRHGAAADAQAIAAPRSREASDAPAAGASQVASPPNPAAFVLPDDVVADTASPIEQPPPTDPSGLKAATEKSSLPAAPSAAARSLARALEALNVTTAPDAAKSSAPPAATDSFVKADIVAANVPTIPAPQGKDGAAPDVATRIVSAPATSTPSAELSAAMSQGGASFGEGRENSGRQKSEVRLKADTVTVMGSDHGLTPPQPTLGSDHGLTPTRAVATAPQAAEVARAHVQDAEVVEQVVKAMRTQFRDGVGEAQIRLKPEHLGEVRIDLKVEGDRVSAVLQVERPEVRQAIEAQSHTLRSGLAAQGLNLDDLEVRQTARTPDDRARDDERRGQQHQPPSDRQPKRRRQDREFELTEG